MPSTVFANSLLAALLLGNGAKSATVTPAPKPTCPAECTIQMQAFEHWVWQSIVLTTTYTHTVILIIDGSKTLTSTKTVAIPESEALNYAYLTNAEGTATTTVASQADETVLAYPTEFINYPAGYPVLGTFNFSGKCYTDTFITWKSQDLTSLTQPVVSTPSRGDRFGTLYTIAGTAGEWPGGWLSSRLRDTLPSDCNLAAIAPASAVQGALLLTTTSISTRSGCSTAAPSSTARSSSTLQGTTPLAVQNPSKTSVPATSALITSTAAFVGPPVVIGSTTVPVSAVTLQTAIASQTKTGSQPGTTPHLGTSSQAGSLPQAVVIGSQTVMVGNTVAVGGMTVIVTTGTDASLRIVYGTTTVMVGAATMTAGGGGGMGSYIMNGLSGPTTGSDSGSSVRSSTRTPNLQPSAAAGSKLKSGLESDGFWHSIFMVLLSFLWR
ncbi:hypothetical protein FKW77_010493 [Venturia effusa]|uniref:Uncharacterized protein n=1 Tax=Venturia effusa TaxID=50376 RepID=A0A517L0J7_9PEZI|nr:hypothetical protein FKW77_010493 [Venturia effusa]